MPARVVALSFALALLNGAFALGQEEAGGLLPTDLLGACSPATPESSAPAAGAEEPDLVTGKPDGSEVVLLGSGAVDDLPRQGSPLVLTVRQVRLVPGAATEQRLAAGPLLYHVVSGAVRFSVNGEPIDHAAGGSPFVQTGQFYRYLNPGAEPLVLLRLALVPSDRESNVGYTGGLADVNLMESAAPEGSLDSRVFVSGQVSTLPTTGLSLFFACASWTDIQADAGYYRPPGPVAISVLHGRLRVDDLAELREGGCRLFLAFETHSVQAADPAPVILLAGALPEGRPLWTTAPSATPSPAGPDAGLLRAQCEGE
jgi:quercetin dioxygenase-like cupin family protein